MTDIELIGFGPWLKYIWKGHIINWLWRDKLKRRITRNMARGEFKMAYLQKYADFAKNLTPEPAGPEVASGHQDEKIYTLWFQGEENAPEIVKKCIDSVKEKYPDKLVILTEKTLFNYISLPDFIMKKREEGKIGAANFSDLVRIELLYKYGGFWFDATDFLTDNIPEEIIASPFFMYVSSDVFFPHMFVQTCFMRVKKKDPLLGLWRSLVFEYWKNEEISCEYFLVHMLLKLLVRENSEARKLFDRMPKRVMDPTHRLWYEIGNLPFDRKLYEEMKKEVFFQKCSYRHQKRGVKEIIPGSMADVVINGKA